MKTERSHVPLQRWVPETRRIGGYFWFWMVLWTLVVAGLLINDIRHIREWTRKLAVAEARVHLSKDMAASLGPACNQLRDIFNEADVIQYESPWLFPYSPVKKPRVFIANNVEADLSGKNKKISRNEINEAAKLNR